MNYSRVVGKLYKERLLSSSTMEEEYSPWIPEDMIEDFIKGFAEEKYEFKEMWQEVHNE